MALNPVVGAGRELAADHTIDRLSKLTTSDSVQPINRTAIAAPEHRRFAAGHEKLVPGVRFRARRATS